MGLQRHAVRLAQRGRHAGLVHEDVEPGARDLAASHRRQLIAWQEELDWQIYEVFGLVEEASPRSSDRVSLPEGEGVLISSPLDEVFAYLDDPANADLFVEVARYQRTGE